MANHSRSHWLAAIISLFVSTTVWAGERSSDNRPTPSDNTFLTGSSQSPIQFQLGVDRLDDARLEPRSAIDHSNTLIRRLPPVTGETPHKLPPRVANASREESIDGTWREDGQFITINLNGQELKLAKADARTAGLVRPNTTSGEVLGRLSHGGRALEDCLVALIPLTKTWNGYNIDGSSEPLRATTDDHGVYHFVDVSPGQYKLSWLPSGQRQWIRRVQFRPDVRVKANDVSTVKEIRVSLRTIN